MNAKILPEPIAGYLAKLNESFAQNKLRKRNGHTEAFDLTKVYHAVSKCFGSSECDYAAANATYSVCHELLHLKDYAPAKVFDLEEIQNEIEVVLMKNYPEIARKFIIYREQRAKAREDKKAFDVNSIIGGYIGKGDWRVKENASVPFSIGGLILHNSGSMSSHFWLSKVYTKEIRDAHIGGAVHIHDLCMIAPYCMGLSLRKLIEEGIPGINGNLASAPARHLSTICHQIVNFIGIHQNESAGAQALSSVDTWLAPFVRYDNLNFDQVKQCIQSLVFGLNTPSRWGTQSPFSNFTFDTKPPKDLRDYPVIIGGKPWGSYTYKDFQPEMDLINKVFIEVMTDGDYNGRTFSYPIPTYNITEDFDWDSDISKALFKLTGKYGTPYFQNFLNSELDPNDVRSMCCRLMLNLKDLHKRGGGLFGSSDFTGSLGVVTINLPRIGYAVYQELRDKTNSPEYADLAINSYFEKLKAVMDIARDSLELKRKTIKHLSDLNMYPYIMHHIRHWNNHFNTIGIVGMNEAVRNVFRHKDASIAEASGREFALKIMDFMRQTIIGYQEETGNLYNFEATPAESTSYRLAKIDKKYMPDILTAGTDDSPYYTNSTQLPVDFTDDIFEALDHQEEFQKKYTGGTVFHAHLGESLRSDDEITALGKLVKSIASNYKIPYFTISPTFSICEDHGYMSGHVEVCPECGKTATVFARIVGYYRAVKNWNQGKVQEFVERETFKVN